MLKELSAKKCVKLGKLMKDRGSAGVHIKQRDSRTPNPNPSLRSEFSPMKVTYIWCSVFNCLLIHKSC